MLNAEDIPVCYAVGAVGDVLFYLFGCVEVNEAGSYKLLCDLVSRCCCHRVSDDGAVFRDRDIRCTGTDIDESDVYKSYLRRNDNVHGGDRLKGKARDFKPVEIHDRIQTFYDNTRQESGNKIYRRLVSLMPLKAYHLVIIEHIVHDGMSDAVEYGPSGV